MADQPGLPQEPAKVHRMPDWEVPTRSTKRSLFSKYLPASKASASGKPILPVKESANQDVNGRAGAADTSTFQVAQSTPTGRFSTYKTSFQGQFDRILPPQKRYFGRSRRFLLLFIVLPIFLLLILILGLGLGFGLRHHSSSQNLPLPGSGVQTGDLTYYTPAQGACSLTNDESDMVVAIAHKLFDAAGKGQSNPNNNPLCGRKIRVQRDFVETGAGNRSVDVKVVDRCTGCDVTDLDLSPAAFKKVALESSGRVQGQWAWL